MVGRSMIITRSEEGPLLDELYHDAQRLLSARVTSIFYYVACILQVAYGVFGTSYLFSFLDGTIINDVLVGRIVVLAVVVCELGVLVNKGYERRDAYALLALIVMGAGPLSRMSTPMLYPALLIFCGRSFDVRRTVTVCTCALTIAVTAVMICGGIGIVDDTVFVTSWRIRHCLGFTFCLFPSMYLFMITCCVCFLRDEALTLVEGVLLLVANVLMFVLTRSETSFGLPVLLLVAIFVLRLPTVKRLNLGWFWKMLSWSMLIAFVVSVILTLLYGVLHDTGLGWLDGLNAATRGRFSYAYEGIKEFGVTALGQYVPWQGAGLSPYGYNPHIAKYNYVDNMFMHVLLEQGWIYVLGYVAFCTGVTRKAFREQEYMTLLVMGVMAAYCIFNDLTMYLHYNLLLFLISGLYVRTSHNGNVLSRAEES